MNYKLKGIVIFLLFFFAALGLGVAISKLIIHNATNISKAENHCGRKAADKFISDYYIESLLTTNVILRDKRAQVINGQNELVLYTDAYTLFGIKLATVTSICDSKTKELMCAALSYQIWSKATADPNLPCG